MSVDLRASALLVSLLLVGCGKGDGDGTSAESDTDTDTVSDTDDRAPVDSGQVRVELAEVEAIDPSELALVWTGVRVVCDEGQASLAGEFIGPVGQVVATPIVAGALGKPVDLAVSEGSVFRTASGAVAASCDDTSWRMVVTSGSQVSCVATGPGAAAWVAASSEDCELR